MLLHAHISAGDVRLESGRLAKAGAVPAFGVGFVLQHDLGDVPGGLLGAGGEEIAVDEGEVGEESAHLGLDEYVGEEVTAMMYDCQELLVIVANEKQM